MRQSYLGQMCEQGLMEVAVDDDADAADVSDVADSTAQQQETAQDGGNEKEDESEDR